MRYEELIDLHNTIFNGLAQIIEAHNGNKKILYENGLLVDKQLQIYVQSVDADLKTLLTNLEKILNKHIDKKGDVDDYQFIMNIYLEYQAFESEKNVILGKTIAIITERTLELAPHLGAMYRVSENQNN